MTGPELILLEGSNDRVVLSFRVCGRVLAWTDIRLSWVFTEWVREQG